MIDFMKELGISEVVISDITNTYSDSVLFSLSCNRFEIGKIISYFKDLGIVNINEIVSNNLDFFFQTFNDVKALFMKYDIKRLVELINSNSEVIKELF